MMPNVEALPSAPSVTFWWHTSDDGKRHTLRAFVDSWQIDVPYGVHWIEGEALALAIDLEQLPEGTAAGWYVQDDCGDLEWPEPDDPHPGRPLDVMLWREIVAKLEEVRSAT